MALMKFQPGNILGGTFTFYLVATAWMTAKRRNEKRNIFDWAALLLVLAVAATEVTFAFQALRSQTGLKYGYPAGPYFFIGSVALLALAGDVRMLVRGGVSGTQRIARHLWRMCFGWFIASGSIFLARAASLSRTHAQVRRPLSADFPATDVDDFLARPNSLGRCIQAKADAKPEQCLPGVDLDLMASRDQRERTTWKSKRPRKEKRI